MDEEVVPLGHDVQVVDPDVRNYVYGLVTAVSFDLLLCIFD
jgi:replication fork protection complex subunit Tof1/Swi1